MTVLIVDDNHQNLCLLRVLLEGHGCAVDEARHGAEALTKARLRPALEAANQGLYAQPPMATVARTSIYNR